VVFSFLGSEIYPLCFIPYEKIMNRSSSSSSSLAAAAAAAARTRTMVSEAPLLELPKRIKRRKGKEIWQKSSAVVCVLRRPG
jgi:hypothetical protein